MEGMETVVESTSNVAEFFDRNKSMLEVAGYYGYLTIVASAFVVAGVAFAKRQRELTKIDKIKAGIVEEETVVIEVIEDEACAKDEDKK